MVFAASRRRLLKEGRHLVVVKTRLFPQGLHRGGLLREPGANRPDRRMVAEGFVQPLGRQVLYLPRSAVGIEWRQRRHEALAGHDMDPIRGCSGHLREEALQIGRGVRAADGGRGGDEAYVRRIHLESVENPPEQQRHFGSL